MKAELIIYGEVYSKLGLLCNEYEKLIGESYPTQGARYIAELIIKIIKLIRARYENFSLKKIQHIKTSFFPLAESICGTIAQSTIDNIPWSIVPAINKFFRDIYPRYEFIVCPVWEKDYSINKKDIIQILYNEVIKTPELLFDYDKDFESNIKVLLKGIPTKVFILKLPRVEKLSSLHFALLGHEIGHIFALDWINKNFSIFLKDSQLEEIFSYIAEKEFEKEDDQFLLFKETNIRDVVISNILYIKNILTELICDLYGVFLFGETALIASYFFADGECLDDVEYWKRGYLSWRFRIKNAFEVINEIQEHHHYDYATNYKIEDIFQDFKLIIEKPKIVDFNINEYIFEFLNAFHSKRTDICSDISRHIDKQIFYDHIKDDILSEVVTRLNQNIPPNCILNANRDELPIDFRNILFGGWIYFCQQIGQEIDVEKYENLSKYINRMCLKAIEYSVDQENFYDFIRIRNRKTVK